MHACGKFGRTAILCAALAAWPGAAAAQPLPEHPRIDYAYIPPASMAYLPTMKRLKARQTLELLSQFLSPLRLPHPFFLIATECGEVNAYYDDESWTLTICYEYADFIEAIVPKPDSPVAGFTPEEFRVGAMVGVVLHEVGHAVFDMLNVPVFGREEDAADQMASFIALQFNKDVARTITRSYAFLYKEWNWAPTEWADYSDEHGTDAQRFYNSLCLGYGGDPAMFRDFVDKGWLPRTRADNCASEYEQLKLAFGKTVLPFIDQDAMKKVQAKKWWTLGGR
jgi:hypothetical protein